jgi:hypothetical protein
MLGIGGKFAASKGMVVVPNLSGLSSSAANALLSSYGLISGSVSSTSTGNSSLNNTVYSQSISAGTLVEYETSVGYVLYSYVAPPPPTGPTLVSDSGCVYTDSINYRIVCTPYVGVGYGYSTWDDRTYGIRTYSDGSSIEYTCSVTPGGNEGNIVGQLTECGYVAPTCSGSYKDNVGFTGSCSGGQRCTYYNWYDSCGNYLKTTQGGCTDCCTAGLISCSTVQVANGVFVKTCTYRRADCSTYTESTTTCTATSSTSCGSCVYAGYTIGSYKSCTTTTRSTSCTTSTSTKSVKC